MILLNLTQMIFFLSVRLLRAKIPVNILHFSSVDIERDGQNVDLPAIKINSRCDC